MTFPIGKISLCPVLSGGFTACGKTQVFVSGYRFSDTASSSESDAPLGAGRRHLTFSVASLHVTPQCLLLLESWVIVDPPAAGSDDSGCIVANPEVSAGIGKRVVNLDYYSTPVAEVAEPTDLNHLFVGTRN